MQTMAARAVSTLRVSLPYATSVVALVAWVWLLIGAVDFSRGKGGFAPVLVSMAVGLLAAVATFILLGLGS